VTEKVSPQSNSTNLHIVHLHDNMKLSWEAIALGLNRSHSNTATLDIINISSSTDFENKPGRHDDIVNNAVLLGAKLTAEIDPFCPVDTAVTEKISPQNNSTNLHIVHLHDTIGLSWAAIAAA